ncbi:MAG TPA: hypothetical protein VHE99_00415 [Gammaproteobacteria bacterium]|nr:hypothetical protein [Gammaproteobacteria bacterium]
MIGFTYVQNLVAREKECMLTLKAKARNRIEFNPIYKSSSQIKGPSITKVVDLHRSFS